MFVFYQFKVVYAKLTKDKTKDTRTLEDILAAYDNGDLHVPCVQLQCIGFDDNFFTVLSAQRDAQSTVPWAEDLWLSLYILSLNFSVRSASLI